MNVALKPVILFFVLLITAFMARADMPYNAWWQAANRYYQEKNYDSAVANYERLAALRPDHAEVYFNLGNSYYKLNRIGPAVLNYERSLKIDPGSRAAKENLELTQSRVVNRIPGSQEIFFIRWWKSLTQSGYSALWAVVSLLLFITTLIIPLLRSWGKEPRWMHPLLAWITAGVCICTLLLAYSSATRAYIQRNAVVMEQDSPLQTAPAGGKIQLLLPEGTVLRIEKNQEEWSQVRLSDGRIGWIRTAALQTI